MQNLRLVNGSRMPIIGQGTWQMEGEECTKAVSESLKIGYRHIDTAEAYGNEEFVGKGIKDSGVAREDIFLTSKLWISNLKYDDALIACERSLEKLDTDYLDLYLIHWPVSSSNLKGTLQAMKKLLDDGKIRAFGVSNFTEKHIDRAVEIAKELGIKIAVNQVEFHPGLYQKNLLAHCKDNDIVLTAYSPLTRGNVSENETIKEISDKYNKTPAQVALRWIIDKDVIVIPKASSSGHIKENFDIFDFILDDEDTKKIDDMGDKDRLINPGFAEFDKEDVFNG